MTGALYHAYTLHTHFHHADFRSKYPSGLRSEPKLSDLMNHVAAKILPKWHELGIALDLAHNDLECLRALDPHQRFSSIFTKWKEQMTKPYTWLTVIDALNTPTVGAINLARDITSKFLLE